MSNSSRGFCMDQPAASPYMEANSHIFYLSMLARETQHGSMVSSTRTPELLNFIHATNC
jgi:hypothetical protein